MKKRVIFTAMVLMTGWTLAGCGNENAAATEPIAQETEAPVTSASEENIETEEVQEEEATEVTASIDASVQYEDPDTLPQYTYQGTEEYLDVISDYMVTTYAQESFGDEADVFIPYSIIAETDETNPEDILVYGEYDIDGYDLRNSTLTSSCGARNRGVFHLKKDESGNISVTDADLPPTDEESEELFAPVEAAYEKLTALSDEEVTAVRATAIAEYINTNGLYITQWQDYGRKPVTVLNAPETPEDEQFYDYKSSLGYEITYDLREFSVDESSDSDMFGKVEEEYTGTFMVVQKAASGDAAAALTDAASESGISDVEITDAVIGDGIACSRAAWDEKLEDGRIFRYIGYSVSTDEDVLVLLLETTCEDGGNEMSEEELDQLFEDTLSTFEPV